MNFSIPNLPPHLQRYALIALPFVGIVASAIIITPRYLDLRKQNENLVQIRASVLEKQTTLEQLKRLPLGPTVARVPATRDEPVRFMHNLNALAALCRVRLLTYTAPAAAAAPNPNSLTGSSGSTAAPAPGAPPGLPPGTTPAVLTIGAEGTYAATALFFDRLETYSRLLSVSQVSMTMNADSYPVLTTQFQLTRYLGAEDAPQPGGASPAPTPTPAPTAN